MLFNILIASVLMIVTAAIHTGAMTLAFSVVLEHKKLRRWRPVYQVAGVILLMFFVMVVEALLWALTYMGLGALSSFESALYFSIVTFATLGYGDIVLGAQWRLLSSFEAVNGIIMFGWTTAIVIYAIQQIYTQTLKTK